MLWAGSEGAERLPADRSVNSVDRAAFRAALLRFFDKNRRPLPWRQDRDPYRVLVSEVMLQQTRVQSVIPYFERWMERFPDVWALAEADEQEVLRSWQGLGYYARARNLHMAAREIVEKLGGRIPCDPDELQALPGIGVYTAGAVASIAFRVVVPAVDGNARRVLSRLMDDPSPSQAALQRWATHLVDPELPGDFNQALMELGSGVCMPRAPRCGICPVQRFCAAREAGTQEVRPAPHAQRPIRSVVHALAILAWEAPDGRRVLLRRRPPTGLLGGLWEFPNTEVPSRQSPDETALAVASTFTAPTAIGAVGIRVDPGSADRLPSLEHVFTHMRVRYIPFVFTAWPESPEPGWREEMRWVDRAGAAELPISSAQLKLLDRILESNLETPSV